MVTNFTRLFFTFGLQTGNYKPSELVYYNMVVVVWEVEGRKAGGWCVIRLVSESEGPKLSAFQGPVEKARPGAAHQRSPRNMDNNMFIGSIL